MEKGTKYWTSIWEASPYEKLETPLSEVFDTYSHDDREIIVLGAMEHKAILTEAYNESIIADVDDIIDDIVVDDVVIDSGGGRGSDSDENNLTDINWIACEEIVNFFQKFHSAVTHLV
ncbi:hypothetical protein BC332_31647 [Capsicum chinense]|nr:hypothetical protein BC332_31647 [Capsicum chinense]